MDALCNLEEFPTVFAPQINEFHELFKSRGVKFGSPQDVAPVVERLSTDGAFRDEMASMVRTVIYRARDGLSPLELLELVLVAVGGSKVDQAAEEIREPVRELLNFLQGVFRTRWNPGGVKSNATERVVGAEPEETPEAAGVVQEAHASEVGTSATGDLKQESSEEPRSGEGKPSQGSGQGEQAHAETTKFYRALMVAANRHDTEFVDEADLIAEAQRQARPAVTTRPAVIRVPFESTIRVPFESTLEEEIALDDEDIGGKRESWRWFWVALVGALLLAVSPALMLWHRDHRAAQAAKQSTATEVATTAPKASRAVSHRHVVGASASPSQSGGRANASHPIGTALPKDGGVDGQGTASMAMAIGDGMKGAKPDSTMPVPVVAQVTRPVVPATGSHLLNGPGRISGVSAHEMEARLLAAPRPEYPALARMAHVQGRVVVEAVIGKDGSVVRAKVVSGHRLLRAAALQEVYQRQYRPYILDDRPRELTTLVMVDFRLHP
jgi:TonB family protein